MISQTVSSTIFIRIVQKKTTTLSCLYVVDTQGTVPLNAQMGRIVLILKGITLNEQKKKTKKKNWEIT